MHYYVYNYEKHRNMYMYAWMNKYMNMCTVHTCNMVVTCVFAYSRDYEKHQITRNAYHLECDCMYIN